MSIARSQSAPQPLAHSFRRGKHNPRGAGYLAHDDDDGRATGTSIPRSQSFHTTAPAYPPYRPPSRPLAREDPFSLSTFFPTQPGREGEWHWLEGLYDDERHEETDFAHSPSDETMHMHDNLEDTVKAEDKLGILSLRNPFSGARHEQRSDKRFLSAYSDGLNERPMDDKNAVYETARLGRQEPREAAKKRLNDTKCKVSMPTIEQREEGEEEEPNIGWRLVLGARDLIGI